MTRVTIFGGHGFVGSALCRELRARGHDVIRQPRDTLDPPQGGFGTVVWCIGLTADFRTRPIDTATAHVGLLAKLLGTSTVERVVYLSSTRVYGAARITSEDSAVSLRPTDPSDLYNATKLAGEALVLTALRDAGSVVRLSNVVGPAEHTRATFIGAITRQAMLGKIVLESAPESAKDYLWIDDAARGLADIATKGRARIYNLARGAQTPHAAWARALAGATGCEVSVREGAPLQGFAPIDISRLNTEFRFAPKDPLDKVLDILTPRNTTDREISHGRE